VLERATVGMRFAGWKEGFLFELKMLMSFLLVSQLFVTTERVLCLWM